jgi:NHL repeat.
MSEDKVVAELAPESEAQGQEQEQEEEKKKRRRWLLLLLLLLLLCCLCGLFYRYTQQRKPLPELVAPANVVVYPPTYLFSIYGVDRPVGVAVSPDGERIYVAEIGGERLIKVFDRDGVPLFSFNIPHTRPGERAPVYLAVDANGDVFVSDRTQHAIYVFDADGNYLDTILDEDLSLSEYLRSQVPNLPEEVWFTYNVFWDEVRYRLPQEENERTVPRPEDALWAPLGLNIDAQGNLWVTDVQKYNNRVLMYPAQALQGAPYWDWAAPQVVFGATGEDDGQFLFPNGAIQDAQGRVYVSDGNNGRISVWQADGQFLFNFGRGTGEGALSLPRGLTIDERQRLYVVDAVGQDVKVYDLTGERPDFMFTFGEFGVEDGQFNYPNAIAVDGTGRLYIADRENNRIQVWTY